MKTKLILLFLAAALLVSSSACSSEAPQELSVDISYSGKEVALANGGTLTVTLESNPSTGYSWNENAKIIDKTVIQQTDHRLQPALTPLPGAGGLEIWTFKAIKPGKTIISMEYHRPFESGIEPTKTFGLAVVVK